MYMTLDFHLVFLHLLIMPVVRAIEDASVLTFFVRVCNKLPYATDSLAQQNFFIVLW